MACQPGPLPPGRGGQRREGAAGTDTCPPAWRMDDRVEAYLSDEPRAQRCWEGPGAGRFPTSWLVWGVRGVSRDVGVPGSLCSVSNVAGAVCEADALTGPSLRPAPG